MSNNETEQQIAVLKVRVSQLTDEITILRSQVDDLRSKVSGDMRRVVDEISRLSVAKAR